MIIIVPQRLEKYFSQEGRPEQRFHQWMVDMTDRQTLESDGSPEGVVEARRLVLCIDTTNHDLYYKTTETGKTGWQLLT